MTQPTRGYDDKRDIFPEERKKQITYRVLCSNLGWVTDPTTDCEQALTDWKDYVEISRTQTQHRGYQEQVSLWSSEEEDPLEIYDPPIAYDDKEEGESE